MTNFATYELNNYDSEDISDVLVKVEKSFDYRFGNTELKDIKTVGELCDMITTKVSADHLNDCTTQQAFYKLRDTIAVTLNIDKAGITTGTDLQQLFPRRNRRENLKNIDNLLGFKTNILKPAHFVSGTLIIILLASFTGLFISWPTGLIGMIISIAGIALATKFGNESDINTVGEFAEKISKENYLKSRRLPGTANKTEIAEKVKELFITELGLEKDSIP